MREGPISRAQLAQQLGLSKPTVSAIVRDLEDAGWVHASGRLSGGIGRTAVSYEVQPSAASVVGVDLGGTRVRAAVCGLDGEILAEREQATAPSRDAAVLDQIARLVTELAGESTGRLFAVAVGTPGVVDPSSGRLRLVPNLPGLAGVAAAAELEERLGLPVTVENDVNLAALGEHWQGSRAELRDFVFIAVGTGIGMGIVLDGALRRGSSGAAGEVGFLPLGSDPLSPAAREHGPLEHFISGPAMARRYAESTGRPPAGLTAELVLSAANAGEAGATDVVDATARALAEGIAAVSAVLDPGLVVLGGGLGSTKTVRDAVRGWLDRLMSDPPPVEASTLGSRAAVVGGLRTALHEAHGRAFPMSRSFGSASALPAPAGGRND